MDGRLAAEALFDQRHLQAAQHAEWFSTIVV